MPGEEPKSIPVANGDEEPAHIGEAAPEQEQIPEEQGQAIGELALGEDTNPGAPQVSGVDESTARTMAYAGDELRTKAVANRDIKRDYEEHENAFDSTFSHGPKTGVLKDRLMNIRDSESAAIRANRKDNEKARREFAEDFKHGERFTVFPSNDAAERAVAYDERASRVEDWAGALHNRQVSNEFKEAHPDIELTPQNLAYMEDDIAILEDRVEELSKPSDAVTKVLVALIRGTVESTEGGRHVGEIYEMLASAGKEHSDAFERLGGKTRMIGIEIDALYDEITEEVKLGPLKNQLAMSRKVMSDIKKELGIDTQDAGQTSEPKPESEPGSSE